MDEPAPEQATSSSLHISDVIEVLLNTEPAFGEQQDLDLMYNPSAMESKQQAWVKIVEQPASKALRFRYECEGRSAGSIPGASSSPENKTFPTIQVCGYQGRAVVVVSCVTKDAPHRPHPHNLVGKEGCKKGVCTMEISGESMTATFSNLGIQCVKKKDIDEALRVREEMRVDPFRTGFAHRSQPTSIDLNAVRLCFQVFLEGADKGKFTFGLRPVVSDTIYDKKAMSDLVICKLSDSVASVGGGREIILLCEKVAKEDIQVRFFTEDDGRISWEGFGDFTPSSVHKQVAITFRTPRYRILEVDSPVSAFIQLRRPSDGATSDPVMFTFTPDPELKRKKPKQVLPVRSFPADSSQPTVLRSHFPEATPLMPVKREPVLEAPRSYMYNPSSPMYVTTPSPQQNPAGSPHMGRTPSPMNHSSPQWTFQDAAARLQSALVQQAQAGAQQQQQQAAPLPQPLPQPTQPLSHHHTPSPTPEFLPQQPFLTLSPAVYSTPISSFGMGPQPVLMTLGAATRVQLSGHNPVPSVLGDPRFGNTNLSGGTLSRVSGSGDGAFVDSDKRLGAVHIPASAGQGETGGSILDLDSRPSVGQLGQLDSSDLAQLLGTNLSNNLNLGDEERPSDMSDSLTRLANTTLQDLCDLNNMCRDRDSSDN